MDLPGYEIVEMLGAGGFGTVYRARQLAVQREIALKIDSRMLATERDRRRFMREVTAAGRLSGHPHVVAVYDAGVLTDGRPFMVLELCPGGSLSDRLHDQGVFPAAEVRDIGVRIADALAAAHSTGVLHRDVKPGNILIDRYGSVALADFGLAAMPMPGLESSATREALTPAFAPPEAFRLAEPAPPGDVYSLAASLYALLSGRPPHVPPDGRIGIAELMAAQSLPVPDVPGAPPALVAVLRQAMAYDPATRTPSAAAFRDALAALDPRGLSSTTDRRFPPPTPTPTPASSAGPSTPPEPVPSTASSAAPATVPPRTPAPGFGTFGAERTGDRGEPAATMPGDRATVSPGSSTGASRGVLLGAAALVTAGILGAGALVAYAQGDGGFGGSGGTGADRTGQSTPGVASGNGATAQREDAAGGGTTAGGGLGVPTTTTDCPAAGISGARAACPQTAECWGGMVSNAGDTTATRRDCRTTHTWQTYAIALMPADGETWNDRELERHPTVRRLCSVAVLLASRSGAGRRKPAAQWTTGVLPPSKSSFERGARSYRCLATQDLDSLRGVMFRPATN